MFKRNKKIQCNCGKNIDSSYSYCPFCGSPLRPEEERRPKEPDNLFDALDDQFKMPFLFKFPMRKLVKEIEQQFREMDKALQQGKEEKAKIKMQPMPMHPISSQGISISIGGSPDGRPVIRVKKFGPGADQIRKRIINEKNKEIETQSQNKMSVKKELTKAEKEKLKQFAKLPREEPKTNIRRLSDRIIYEILVPGIKDKRNIIINKLPNSIEIKAFTKNKAYFKLIPLGLPITKHYLEKDKLILELKPGI